ncbi:MAG: ABC transporter permease subunit [Planctomycetota bacterium]
MANTQPDNPPAKQHVVRSIDTRMRNNVVFNTVCFIATMVALVILLVLLASIFTQGIGSLSLRFIGALNSSDPHKAGIWTSLVGTMAICLICAVFAIFLGVGTAILIEEFKPRNRYLLWLHGIIDTNIRNLAGVPSIVYGILGVTVFATMFYQFGDINNGRFAIGQSWYDQYQGEDKQLYYTEAGGPNAPGKDAEKGMTLYLPSEKGIGIGEEATDLIWVTEEEIAPRVSAIEEELDAFEDAFRAGITGARESRRGPVRIDQAGAEAIVEAAIEAGTWKNPDTTALREKLVGLVLGLDGKKGVDLIKARKEAINRAVESEYDARMENIITIGAPPVRVNTKAWYHLALPFGRGVLAGGLTLMLVILPIVIVASQEALRAVPGSYRQGALALGATKWQSVQKTALPAAIPGICTGTILAISRAIGEAAPILVLGGTGFITSPPRNLMDSFSAMPMTIFQWTKEPEAAFKDIAAAGIIVLLIVLLSFNALAIYIRQRSSKHQ